MLTVPVSLVLLCLSATPPDEGPAPEPAQYSTRRKAYETGSSSQPSEARKAAISSTLAKRRAYRQRIKGNASRQFNAIGPQWSAMMAQAMSLQPDV